jgi:hypothetical protein
MLFTFLHRGKNVHKFNFAVYSKREIFMSPAHILQTERWHVWAAPLFTHCYPTANESFENVYKLKLLNPTVTKHIPNYAQDISVRNFTIPLKYTEDI